MLSELRPHIRRSLNAELLLILEAQGVSPGYMLHHAREAGNTEQVRRLAPRAAREASELGARREAAAFFGIALEAEGPGASADLLEEVAHAHYMVGLFPEAVGFQKRAQVIHAQSLDPLREGDGARRLSRYLWGQSKTSEAFAEAERAAQILANRRGPELALALSSVAQLRMLAYDYDRVEDLAESAIALAREFDRPDIESHALNNLAMARTYSDPGLARAGMQDSLEIAQRIGHDDHVIRAYTNFTYLELLVRNYKAAREQAVRGIAFAEEQELDAYYNYLIGTLACVELNSGHHDRAFELASPHFVSADFVSTDLYRFSGAVALFCLATRKGEVPDANAVAVLDQFRNPDAELQRIAPYAEALAERAWITGSGIEDALGMLRLSVEKSPISEAVQSVHVWLHRLDASAHTPNMDRFNDFHRLELEGRPEEAAAALEPLGARYEQALALAQGGTDAKIRAIAILEEIGASASAARVQSMLPPDARPPQRKGPRASTRENAAGLTKRQMDVLRELDNGLSNAEIAEKLFVSPKTVDHHVSAILGKLDAQNRSEAAAIARRTGLIFHLLEINHRLPAGPLQRIC